MTSESKQTSFFLMPTYNALSPGGVNGIQYDLRTSNDSLIGGGSVLPGMGGTMNAGDWYQSLNWPATLKADQRAKAGMVGGSMGAGGADFAPVINPATGLFVNPTTGQAFSGTDPSGKTYQGGRITGEPVPYNPGQTINPNDPNQRYRAVDIIKAPGVANATSALMDRFNKTSATALQDFGQYLNAFKNQVGTAQTRSAAATDIGPFANTMRGYQGAYADALNRSMADYEALNRQTAGNEMGIVQEARDLIPEYDRSINNLRAYQSGQLQSDINSRYSAGATPRSMGSGLARELVRGEAAISVPLEQAKIAQRYNVLSQYAMPATLDIANRETARIANFNPMVAAQQFQSGQATEQTIQQLAMVTANMTYDNAIRYMQALSVPVDLQQRIMSGDIANLGGLNQLYSGSRYQGLQDVLGANVTPSVGYNLGVPGYPGGNAYRGGPSYAQPEPGLQARNAPQYVDANAQQAAVPQGSAGEWVWDANNQVWKNWRTGAVQRGQSPPYNGQDWVESGTQSNSYYDPTTQTTIDRYTGKVTGTPIL